MFLTRVQLYSAALYTDTDFVALGCNNSAWNVVRLVILLAFSLAHSSSQVRSEFDQLLMNHARTSGASVYELTKVTSVSFCPTDPSKPISVTWRHTPPPAPLSPPASPSTSKTPDKIDQSPTSQGSPLFITGTTTFDYLIDATGRAGVMSTKYLRNRHFNVSLKNVAVWGYWVDVGSYGVGTKRQGAPWFEALTGETPPPFFSVLKTFLRGVYADVIDYH
jgi:hypothetical protein